MKLTSRYKKALPIIIGSVIAIPIAGFIGEWPPEGAIIFAAVISITPLFGYLLNPDD